MKIITAILLTLFCLSCKEKKEVPEANKHGGIYLDTISNWSTDTAKWLHVYPASPYYSIEEKKLDTVIMLLRKQNILLKKLSFKKMK